MEKVNEEPVEIKLLDVDEIKKPTKGQELLNNLGKNELLNPKVKVQRGNAKPKTDKYGIPISKNRKNWDIP